MCKKGTDLGGNNMIIKCFKNVLNQLSFFGLGFDENIPNLSK